MEANKSTLSVLKQVSSGKVLSSYLLRTLVAEEVISFKRGKIAQVEFWIPLKGVDVLMVICSVLLKEFTAFVVVQQIFNGMMSQTFPGILKKNKK